jgi:hypothetical protein
VPYSKRVSKVHGRRGHWRVDCNNSGQEGKAKISKLKGEQNHGDRKTDQEREEARSSKAANENINYSTPAPSESHLSSSHQAPKPACDRSSTSKAAVPGTAAFFFFRLQLPKSPHQICDFAHRQVARQNCQARGELFPEILAVPVIPSRSDPSVFGNSISTAK